jgi:archaellum biogenesis ATPase FlaH
MAVHGRVTVCSFSVNGYHGAITYDITEAKEVEALRSFLRFNETQPHNIFYIPNFVSGPVGARGVPARDDVVEINAIVIDLDPDKDKPIDQERMRIRQVVHGLLNGPVQPFAVVNTGGGAQVIFKLVEPILITPNNRHRVTIEIENLYKDVARALGGDPATHPIKNLFRTPGTTNWPTPSKRKAGREISFGNVWFDGGPKTTLEELRSLALREGGPADPTPQDSHGVDLGDIQEGDLIEVLAKPDKLPARLRALVTTNQALYAAAKRPPDPNDTSAKDMALCMTMINLHITPGDMALILCAYGEKVKTTHYDQNRLFSYVRTTISNAFAKDPINLLDPANFDEVLAAKEREQAAEKAQAKFNRFRPIPLAELLATDDDLDDELVEGLMGRQSVTVIYGESGAGKTFVTLDLAYRVSMGMEWCGRKTLKCHVVYIAAESPRSVRRRLRALADTYGVSDHFHVVKATPEMSDPKAEDVDALGKQIAALKVDVGMIVIDTLARTMRGNENSTQDMSQLVANGDHLRDGFKANVVWVHHSGKDRTLGARGSSALRAATDAEIEIHDNWFDVTKSRDEGQFRHKFALKTGLIVGKKRSGAPITTCIVQWADGPSPQAGGNTAEMTRRDSVIYILRKHGQPMAVGDIHAAAELEGIKLGTRHATTVMLTRMCRDETQRIFKEMGEKPTNVSKNVAKLYGLWEW